MAHLPYHSQEMVQVEDRDRFCGRCGTPNPDPDLAPPRDWVVVGDVVRGNWELVCPDCFLPSEAEGTRRSVQPPC